MELKTEEEMEILLEESETLLEMLWRLSGGIDPATGKMWLTPRMEREVESLKQRCKDESIS